MGLDVQLPAAADIEPQIYVDDFNGVQPYKIVMVGEKSSLEPVLSPIAESYKADLYLPTGCLSDTLIYQMAKIGADDGRPMVVFYFSDCDPPAGTCRRKSAANSRHSRPSSFQTCTSKWASMWQGLRGTYLDVRCRGGLSGVRC